MGEEQVFIYISIGIWLYFGVIGFIEIFKSMEKATEFKDYLAMFMIFILIPFGPLLLQTALQFIKEKGK